MKEKTSRALKCLEDDVRRTRNRLDLLSDKAQPFLEKALHGLEKHAEELRILLRKHLQGNYTKQRLRNWDEYDFIVADNQANEDGSNGQNRWSVIKKHIDDMIDQRLTDLIVEWEDQNQHILRFEEDIVESVRTELQLLDEDVKDIENAVANRDLHSLIAEQFTERCESHPSPTRKSGPINAFKNIIKDRKETNFMKNIVLEAEKRTMKLLKRLLEGDNETLSKIIASILNALCVQLKSLHQRIPSLVETSKQVLAHKQACIKGLEKRKSSKNSMISDMSLQSLTLNDFNHSFIDMATFISEEIELKEDEWLSKSSSRKSKSFRSSDLLQISTSARKRVRLTSYGLWTALQPVHIKQHTGIGSRRDATVRMYQPSSGVNVNYREISRIR